jgi:hypothetical protein
VGDVAEVHPHWRIDVFMPEVEGQVGPGGGETDVYVERGHCHIKVPRMEVILPLNNIKASLRSGVQRLRQGRQGSAPASEQPESAVEEQQQPSSSAAVLVPALPVDAAADAPAPLPGWWLRQRQSFQATMVDMNFA